MSVILTYGGVPHIRRFTDFDKPLDKVANDEVRVIEQGVQESSKMDAAQKATSYQNILDSIAFLNEKAPHLKIQISQMEANLHYFKA